MFLLVRWRYSFHRELNSSRLVWDVVLSGWREAGDETDLKFLLLWGGSASRGPGEKAPSSFFLFWFGGTFSPTRRRLRRSAVESAGAVAAVLEDALLEERREITDGVFGEMEAAVCVGSERRAGGRQHHPEQVPQITLQRNTTATSSQLKHFYDQRDERIDSLSFNIYIKLSCLQVIPALSDHPLVSVSKQLLWRELESCQLKQEDNRLHQTHDTTADVGHRWNRPVVVGKMCTQESSPFNHIFNDVNLQILTWTCFA